ncbi:MAG: efflux RND transporter periplasmic adaptor subunit [Alphaproteobacteria bacterium]|nr:efflux RND transporter periplasmic adaptor subunit [Alphaproteobacteria bacterium]
MQSSKYVAIIIAVLALIWVGSGIFFPPSSSSATEEEAQNKTAEKKVIDVRVRESEAQPFTDKIEVTGRSQASKSVILRTETAGLLTKVLKEEGTAVALDEALAQIELGDREPRIREARQRVNQRSIEYNAAKKLQDRGFNSKVKLAQTLADLEDAKTALKEAELDLSRTKIKAPFDGIVSEQAVEIGDYLAVGDAMFTVVDLDPIEFVGFVSERHIKDIQLESPVRVMFLNGSEITGTVSYIAPAASENTRTFRVIVSAANEDLSLKEGLTATIYIPASDRKAHKISPSILSLDDEGQIGVKIVNEHNKVVFIPVTILEDTSEAMWISGLPEKTRIITVGQEFVSEGQEVNPVSSDGEGLL